MNPAAFPTLEESAAPARSAPSPIRKARIASVESDVEYLLAALNHLTTEITDLLGPPGASRQHPLRMAVYTARKALYRVVKNKTARERRANAKRAA